MSTQVMSEIRRWISDYGRVNRIDTSWWRVVCTTVTYFIAAIPTEAQAEGMRDYLSTQGVFLTKIVKPRRKGGPWSVMATCP
jgi:hypothetical protein